MDTTTNARWTSPLGLAMEALADAVDSDSASHLAALPLAEAAAAVLAAWHADDGQQLPKAWETPVAHSAAVIQSQQAMDAVRGITPADTTPDHTDDVPTCPHGIACNYVHRLVTIDGEQLVSGGDYWHSPDEVCNGQWAVAGYATHGEQGLAMVTTDYWTTDPDADQRGGGGETPDHIICGTPAHVVGWLTEHGYTELDTDVEALQTAWNVANPTHYVVYAEVEVHVTAPSDDPGQARQLAHDALALAAQGKTMPWGITLEQLDTEGQVGTVDADGTINL